MDILTQTIQLLLSDADINSETEGNIRVYSVPLSVNRKLITVRVEYGESNEFDVETVKLFVDVWVKASMFSDPFKVTMNLFKKVIHKLDFSGEQLTSGNFKVYGCRKLSASPIYEDDNGEVWRATAIFYIDKNLTN